MFYPIHLEKDDNGTVLVSFPDMPWVHTYGDDEADAVARAADALDTAIDYLVRRRQPIPAPARGTGTGAQVAVRALTAAKIALHNIMLNQGVTKADLKRKMNVHGPQVDRLLDTRHSSKFEEVERAFATLGQRIELTVRPELTSPEARHVPARVRRAARKR